MSKKTRKKIIRKNQTEMADSGDQSSDNKSILKSTVKVPTAPVKAYTSYDDFEKRYQYVKDDLKNIAIIAIPLIVILILFSFFIKI